MFLTVDTTWSTESPRLSGEQFPPHVDPLMMEEASGSVEVRLHGAQRAD